MKILLFCLPVLLIVSTSFNYKKHADKVINYLNTDEIIKFNKKEYKLSWSSHPVSNYYKQEYIPKGETSEHYSNLLLIDYLLIDTPAFNIVGVKVHEILERKKTDIVAQYQLLKNPDKKDNYILDFLLSAGENDKINVIEWNGYHYQNYTDKAGHKGVLLFGISKRAYGADVTPFLQGLRAFKGEQLKVLVQYEAPKVEIK